MKILSVKVLLLLCLLPGLLHAADITGLEYFFDTDPGFGNGTAVPVTPGSDLSLTFTADVSTLSGGFHVLYVRGKNDSDQWGLRYIHPFFKTGGTLTAIEYFFDTDPGVGNGTSVSFTSGKDVTVTFSPDLSNVSKGSHVLYVRSRDESGSWGLPYIKPFFMVGLTASPKITSVEYFVDIDPGVGNGTQVPFTPPAADIELNFSIDLSSIAEGTHNIYVRALDSNGDYNIIFVKEITVVDNDSDNDGLDDDWEMLYFSNLDQSGTDDPDHDGLNNLDEYQNNTNPDDDDTDDDLMPDGWEVDHNLNPLINDAAEDPDNDGFSNLEEYRSATDPQNEQSHPNRGVLQPVYMLLLSK